MIRFWFYGPRFIKFSYRRHPRPPAFEFAIYSNGDGPLTVSKSDLRSISHCRITLVPFSGVSAVREALETTQVPEQCRRFNVANTGGEGSSNANEKIEGINTGDILGPAGDEARGEHG